jgi:hypothetical protein
MFMDIRSALRRDYPVRVEVSIPRRGFSERQYNALMCALLGVDYAEDRRHEGPDRVAYRFRHDIDADLFRENVARAALRA